MNAASEVGSRTSRSRSRPLLTRGLVAAIFVLALAIRVAVYIENPKPYDGSGLVAVQAEMARNIVDRGQWFVSNDKAFSLMRDRQNEQHRLIDPSDFNFRRVDRGASFEPEVHQMPGVSVVLSALWFATGSKTYLPIQLLQLLLDATMVLLIYWITRKLRASPPTALLASFLYAVWPGAIVVAKRPMLDTWATFFVIGSLALFLWARDRPSKLWPLIVLGVVTGIGIYFRPFVLVGPVLFALVASPRGWQARLAFLAVPTVVSLVVLSPWTIRNYYEFHRFIPTRTGLGESALEGLGQVGSDRAAARYVHTHRPGLKERSPASDDFLLRRVLHVIAKDPGAYAKIVARHARFLLPCLLLVLLWRRRKTEGLILVAAALSVALPYLLVGGDTRFYLPAAFAYFILLALAGELVILQLRRRMVPVRGRPGRGRASSAARLPAPDPMHGDEEGITLR